MPVARKLWQPMRMQMPAASAQRPITRKTSPCPIGLPDKRPRPAGHEGHLVLSAPASLAAAALATEVSVFDLDPFANRYLLDRDDLTATIDLKLEIKGSHELVVRPNYVIVYRVLQDAVEVLRVLHATQQRPAAKRRGCRILKIQHRRRRRLSKASRRTTWTLRIFPMESGT